MPLKLYTNVVYLPQRINSMKILVTGTAGFIGFHLANRLINAGHIVTGLDSINDYYDINLKYNRLSFAGISTQFISYNKKIISTKNENYFFYQLLLEDKENLQNIFKTEQFDIVINLAAQAGVRYSLVNPQAYVNSNIIGFLNILECCRYHQIKHLIYASSSSVYGLNDKIPFSTLQNTDHPVSLYAASKKSNELMVHVYSHLFNLPVTGFRFFTVYGPWGRPDMALFIFTKSIIENKPIQLFNNGNMLRDFTYVDDVVEGIVRVMHHAPEPSANWHYSDSEISSSSAAYKIYNIGNNAAVLLLDFVKAIEKELGIEAIKEYLPMQPGDVAATFADVNDLVKKFNYKPSTSIQYGIREFIKWYKSYYNIQ
ncbi:MAG: NAD-dependent epimerase [Chitinophagaceae bacterium]